MTSITDPAQIMLLAGLAAGAMTALFYRLTLQHYGKLQVAGNWALILNTIVWITIWILMRLFG